MNQSLIVGAGGFLGAILRFKLGGLIFHHTPNWKFPLSTVLVNVTGCLAAGILAGLAERQDYFSAHTRLFLFAGLLGGYTTFSAFGLETMYLLQRNEILAAIANVGLSVVFGLLAIWIGMRAVS